MLPPPSQRHPAPPVITPRRARLLLHAARRYIAAMQPLDWPPDQLTHIKAILAEMTPPQELAYRLALRGLFARCRGGEWNARIEALLAELATDEATLTRYLQQAAIIADDLDFSAKRKAARSR